MTTTRNGGNGWTITPKDILNWMVPALLALACTGIVMVWNRLGDVQLAMEAQSSRITAIEASRFTAADGLSVWQVLGEKVDRDELHGELQEIKDLIREHDQTTSN